MSERPKLFGGRPYLQTWFRRVRAAGSVLTQGVGGVATDFGLLAGRHNGEPVFRQKRVDGSHLLVRANEDAGRQIYCFGKYEERDSTYIREAIRETDVCIDVGANTGYYSVLLGRLARRGRVHAFEPIPLNYHLLCANLLVNGLANVTASCCAIGDADGEADFFVAADSAYSSLRHTGRRPNMATMPVTLRTLDGYCNEHEIEGVDFIKVDVEGAEERVLKGACQVLSEKTRRPRLLMLELYQPMLGQQGTSIDRILEGMKGYGYDPFVVEEGGLVQFKKHHYNCFYNVFFL